MKSLSLVILFLLSILSRLASANQAADTSIVIGAHNAGPTPFISKLTLNVSNLAPLQRIRFAIAPKPGSVTRLLSATYWKAYLDGRGYVNSEASQITVPVFGLYDGFNNEVVLTYFFTDGSRKRTSTMIATERFDDPCPFDNPEVRQPRKATTDLSYDFILVQTDCSVNAPIVIDTDGAVRWVGTGDVKLHYATFFDNAVYHTRGGTQLLRIELDGEVKVLADYAAIGVSSFNHNIDPGKNGMILDLSTAGHMEVDTAGQVLKRWNLGNIIGAAMRAGGDDPSGFMKGDWMHDNAVAYRKSDNSVIFSSRENFVICLDYETDAIKWILGDTTKQWYQYPSLQPFALGVAPGSIGPAGQHAVSITKDDHLLLFDNGRASFYHFPRGVNRTYSAARKYALDLEAKVATEVWTYSADESIYSPTRSSVYEDAPENYLVDYATALNPNGGKRAELVGLTPSGEKVFDYSYPWATPFGIVGYRALPVHWENLVFRAPTQAPAN